MAVGSLLRGRVEPVSVDWGWGRRGCALETVEARWPQHIASCSSRVLVGGFEFWDLRRASRLRGRTFGLVVLALGLWVHRSTHALWPPRTFCRK
eukprot:1855110-Rhodomonas_salina.1